MAVPTDLQTIDEDTRRSLSASASRSILGRCLPPDARPVEVVTDGIKQSNGKAFRIATLQKEYIIVTQADQVAEYIRAPDNVLNMLEAADDVRVSSLLSTVFPRIAR